MGHFTNYEGLIEIQPPLNTSELSYHERFIGSRRMLRKSGPYSTPAEQPIWIADPDVIDLNQPAAGQPGLSCQWAVTGDGRHLSWNHKSRFYFGGSWIRYLIDTFWSPDCSLRRELSDKVGGREYAPEFEDFSFDHVLNGSIRATEEGGSTWMIVVENNIVMER